PLSRQGGQVRTKSIDALVHECALDRVNLIKMDIEGAELPALRGAEATLRRFRPKLAICAYHRPDDLITILPYLQSLDLGYRFTLGHYSIHAEETVLFGVP
ncbi:MAG TPA: FkbM family methyltransferase, partial [Bacteroidota bacterium]|nr:FkbM family methyltransferase [Bacteroidota bacterium]